MHSVSIMDKPMQTIKTYSELLSFDSFEERLRYLLLRGTIGETTFGFQRYVNQSFYSSGRWREIRNQVIIRDDGCDMALPDFPIYSRVYIHHINPVSLEQLENDDRILFDMENLVCVSYDTHAAIHYGNGEYIPPTVVNRSPGDTKLW